MRHRLPALTHASAALAGLLCLALAGCVQPPPQPTPAPTPAPAPSPTPAPVPAPTPVPPVAHWLDNPATPGDWSYSAGTARFGQPGAAPLVSLRCDRASGVVEISRAGSAVAALPMILRTEFMERSVDAVPARSDPPSIVARVPARDPLLDAMAFSKGRFALEIGGMPTLYAPSWPEVSRVIEDCR